MAQSKQLLYGELALRPGGPWAWNEPGNMREKALPRHALHTLLEKCDLRALGKAERVCQQWRECLVNPEGVGAWQVAMHGFIGKGRIEKYKAALGLRSGQGWEAERLDLTARNWKRILRMHRATRKLPQYNGKPFISRLEGHTGPVLCMALGGPYLFTGGADKALLMYRVPLLVNYTHEKSKGRPTPKASRSFGPGGLAHTGPVLCVVAERDVVISGGVDGLVKMWKVESSNESPAHKVFEKHQGPVWAVAMQPEQRLCCSGGADKCIYLWDMDGPKGTTPLQTMRGHAAGVTALCFAEHSEQVISASEDRTIRVWDQQLGICYSVLEGHQAIVFCLQVWQGSRDGQQYEVIFSGDGNGCLRVWDRTTGQTMHLLDEAHEDAVKSLSMSLSPEYSLISTSMDGTLKLWRPDTMEQERLLCGEDETPVVAGFTAALSWANIVIACSWDGVIRCYVFSEN